MKESRWRAPHEDGAVLVVPGWDELPGLVERNQQLIQQSSLRIGGKSLAEFRSLYSAETTSQARVYAQSRKLSVLTQPLRPPLVIATGHQPELFHPGVLVKNFATARLAKLLNGVGYNLNVDSDVAKTTGLTLPVSAADHDNETLYFSSARPPLPFEEWTCDDEAAYAALPDHARAITDTWPWQPVLGKFWDYAQQAAPKTKLIPERWLIARHQLEADWGMLNHELSLSGLSRTAWFGLLLGEFLQRRAEFATIFNTELAAYRREHKIRSRHHPVADLVVSGDLVELPFWAWPPGTTQRGRLFVRTEPKGIAYLVRVPDREQTIPKKWSSGSIECHWLELLSSGWKIRPKALVTTMMMRLFVSDLFIHGIGGAVYDELTDRIFRRFFGTELPAFAVVTATLRLPWGDQPVSDDDERRLRQTLRTMHWNPDRFLSATGDDRAAQLTQRKQQLIQQAADGPSLRERHEQFEMIRERLRPYVASQARRTQETLRDVIRHHRRDAHRFSREHPWVLYPEQALLRLRDWFQ
jgi:hypothetical protein